MGLALYDPPMPVAPALIAMTWHRRADTTPAHRWLRDVIAGILAPLNQGHPDIPGAETQPGQEATP